MPAITVPPGVEGIAAITELPDEAWLDRWDRIVVPAELKDRLLNYLLFSLRHRGRAEHGRACPIHGLVVLAGPPGTGKTTLAGGLADQAARALGARRSSSWTSIRTCSRASCSARASARSPGCSSGRCPTWPGAATRRSCCSTRSRRSPSSRSRASLETNPVDVHRATDAVLAGVDRVARAWPNVTFVATTNYQLGVDARLPVAGRPGRGDRAARRGRHPERSCADTLREVTGADAWRVGRARCPGRARAPTGRSMPARSASSSCARIASRSRAGHGARRDRRVAPRS